MATTLTTTPIFRSEASDLPDLVTAIGSERFGRQLQDYLRRMCGADHCTVFQLGPDSVSEVASGSYDGSDIAHRRASAYVMQQYWRKDPAMFEVKRCMDQAHPIIIRVDIEGLADHEFREAIYPQIRERLVVAGRGRDKAFGLSILRSEGAAPFSEDEVLRVGNVAELLVSLLSKHADIALRTPRLTAALSSLANIEACIGTMAALPRREAQVCARILHGLSTVGMALDLDVGTESIKTYRKRAYQRLQIGCERELLAWYLALWSSWQERSYPLLH